MIEFRKAKHDVPGFITIQYRIAEHKIHFDGSVQFTIRKHKLVWGPWQDVPYTTQEKASEN